MIINVLYRITLFATLFLCCTACTDENSLQPVPADNAQVRIVYKVAGTADTRVEVEKEPGWNGAWNENKITRIDLFVFEQNGMLYKHIYAPLEGETLEVIDEQNGEYTILETDQLTYSEVKSDNYIYYMVANCPQLANKKNITLDDLKKEMITPPLSYNEKQETFVMDAKITETPLENETTKTITLSFELVRAASKIRLSVQDKEENDIIEQCSFKLINYVSTGTSVLAESEAWGEGANQRRESMAAAQSWEKTLQYEETGSKKKAVFYSYPNDWFDETLLNEDGIFTEPDIYAKDDLIDENKQTYILLTYDGNEFKVPVNFSIADYNDKPSFTADEIKKLRNDYYRMQRNYIYNVTVTVDWEKTEINVTYDILVNAWNDKGDMNITFGDPNK